MDAKKVLVTLFAVAYLGHSQPARAEFLWSKTDHKDGDGKITSTIGSVTLEQEANRASISAKADSEWGNVDYTALEVESEVTLLDKRIGKIFAATTYEGKLNTEYSHIFQTTINYQGPFLTSIVLAAPKSKEPSLKVDLSIPIRTGISVKGMYLATDAKRSSGFGIDSSYPLTKEISLSGGYNFKKDGLRGKSDVQGSVKYVKGKRSLTIGCAAGESRYNVNAMFKKKF